ncbi:hypothetical protein HOL63_00810 [Candidatus Peregrinibacteria bacterium]|jgi:hypothetical protein|nr:hypothetical protein [Candidatus Peregrinibacteria bacterium]
MSGDNIDFQGGVTMSAWKQLWNGVWNNELPKDENIRWMTENFGELFRYGFVVVAAMVIFVIYCWAIDRHYMKDVSEGGEA